MQKKLKKNLTVNRERIHGSPQRFKFTSYFPLALSLCHHDVCPICSVIHTKAVARKSSATTQTGPVAQGLQGPKASLFYQELWCHSTRPAALLCNSLVWMNGLQHRPSERPWTRWEGRNRQVNSRGCPLGAWLSNLLHDFLSVYNVFTECLPE